MGLDCPSPRSAKCPRGAGMDPGSLETGSRAPPLPGPPTRTAPRCQGPGTGVGPAEEKGQRERLQASQLSSRERPAPRRRLRPLPLPLPPGARGSGGSQPAGSGREGWGGRGAARAGSPGGADPSPAGGVGPGQTGLARSRRPCRRRGPRRRRVPRVRSSRTEAGACPEGCGARARRPRLDPAVPARPWARRGEHRRGGPGLGFLKMSGAARRRCDWPRPADRYANEPPPAAGPERRGQSGGVRAGAGRATQSPRAGTPRRVPGPRPPRAGPPASLAPPPPDPLPPLPRRLPAPPSRRPSLKGVLVSSGFL